MVLYCSYPGVSRNDLCLRLLVFPNGEQPKYFMLNLVYAASVIETPSRITRPEVEIRGAPLKVRSETQYLQAYLSLSAPYIPPFLSAGFVSTLVQHHRRLRYHHCFSFRNLRLASFKRSWQLSPGWFAKFPSHLIRGTDILSCTMRKYYSFPSTFFLTSFLSGFTYFYSYYSW